MGIELTQEQKDELFRKHYWELAIRYGLQYYVAGRFAAANYFAPVSANLLHHAVELLLKSCLSYEDPIETIRKYGYERDGYGHNIPKLWDAFKSRQTTSLPDEFDIVISALHAFEEIRYPEELIKDGAIITINPIVEEPIHVEGQASSRRFHLTLPPIDRLVRLLFTASHGNPEVFLREIADEQGTGDRNYRTIKATLLGGASA
jgi:hypothetical protein